MILFERLSRDWRRAAAVPSRPPAAPDNEVVLKSRMVIVEQPGAFEIERKTIFLMLKETARGRILRIIESNGPHAEAINIPAHGLKDIQKILAGIVQAEKNIRAETDANF
jgi:hypothetical protein